MTPKEKCDELVKRFHPLTKSNDKLALEIYGDSICCLIILVEEIIFELSMLPKIATTQASLFFWREVKNEIGKL